MQSSRKSPWQGHSLGGALATIYSKLHGEPSVGVTTFAAPPTSVDESCTVKGDRYFDESDPAASSLSGLGNPFGPFSHDLQNAYVLFRECEDWASFPTSCGKGCVKWNTKAWCHPWGWTGKRIKKEGNCARKSGGCSWFGECAANFLMRHSVEEYQRYL